MSLVRLLFFKVLVITAYSYNVTDVKQLQSDLFKQYDRRIIPVQDVTKPINITIAFSLLDIYGLDIRSQVLSTSVSLQITWTDEFLKWSEDIYNGLEKITTTFAYIWKPDLIVFNSANPRKALTDNDDDIHNVIVNNNGHVEWWIYLNLQTHCKLDMTYYPFDTQQCDINMTKLYLDDRYEMLQSSGESSVLSSFVSDGEWDVLSVKPFPKISVRNRNEISVIIWKIEMTRLRTYYTWNFLMPLIALAIADTFTFFLPAKSSEKIGLSIFVFLAIAVLIRLFNESMPPTSEDISIFGVLLWTNLLVSGLVIVMNIFITALFYRKSLKCISKCCDDMTEVFKCKICKCCKPCMEDQPQSTRDQHQLRRRSEAFRTEGHTEITHGDISIKLTDATDETLIHHRGMEIQLGSLDSIQVKDIEWSDVARNIDIIAYVVVLGVYIVVYAVFITELLREH